MTSVSLISIIVLLKAHREEVKKWKENNFKYKTKIHKWRWGRRRKRRANSSKRAWHICWWWKNKNKFNINTIPRVIRRRNEAKIWKMCLKLYKKYCKELMVEVWIEERVMMLTIVKLFFFLSLLIQFHPFRRPSCYYVCVYRCMLLLLQKRFMPQICLNAFNSSSTATADAVVVAVICTQIL